MPWIVGVYVQYDGICTTDLRVRSQTIDPPSSVILTKKKIWMTRSGSTGHCMVLHLTFRTMLRSLFCRRGRKAIGDNPSHTTTTVFVCVQTQSTAQWALLQRLRTCLRRHGAQIIDYRTNQSRSNTNSQGEGEASGSSTVVVNNELFCRLSIDVKAELKSDKETKAVIDTRLRAIHDSIAKVIQQPSAKINVQRWYPEQQQQLESEDGGTKKTKPPTNHDGSTLVRMEPSSLEYRVVPRRHKTQSTPILGDLFASHDHDGAAIGHAKYHHRAKLILQQDDDNDNDGRPESFDVLISHKSLRALRDGSPRSQSYRTIEIQRDLPPREQLQGLVRGAFQETSQPKVQRW